MHISNFLLFFFLAISFSQCKPAADNNKTSNTKVQKKRIKPASEGYHFENTKAWLKQKPTEKAKHIVLAVNRTDLKNIALMDSIVVPNDASGDIEFYLPFPIKVASLKAVKKIIFFSYATQSFAAYETGELVYAGQTNMGRKADPTPTGLFYTNWKAEQTTSTFNDEWDLKWNFNIENKLGVGFHQYELPGYPASHSCLRLTEKDAIYLYEWADQWKLYNPDSVLAKGTPVIVFGTYAFDSPKPWLQLVNSPHVLDIPESTVQQQAEIFMKDIMLQQQKRAEISVK